MTEVVSARLRMTPMTVEALDALRAGDHARLELVSGARFPDPLEPPPLTADAIGFFQETLQTNPVIAPWERVKGSS